VATERVVIGRGMRSEIIAWGDHRVLKLYHAGTPAQSVAREAEATRRVAQLGVPAPHVHETVEVDGRPGIVMERLAGPSLDQVFYRQPLAAPRLIKPLAELQATMHHIDVTAEAQPLTVQLRRKISSGRSPLAPELRAAALAALDQMPGGSSLCHGDLHPQNVVWAGPRGYVIIDWDSPTYGNPLADVARTYLILTAGRLHVPRRIRPLITFVTRFMCRNYLRIYRGLAGDLITTAGDLNTWLWINAAARLCEGIAVEEPWLTGIVRRGAAAASRQ